MPVPKASVFAHYGEGCAMGRMVNVGLAAMVGAMAACGTATADGADVETVVVTPGQSTK